MHIKFISNKILIKHAEDEQNISAIPEEGLYTSKHAFQGTTHYGTQADFAPHANIMEPLTGPVSTPPVDSTHVSTIKPQHGPMFDSLMDTITKAGGKPMLVGGYPRDWVQGHESKDKDIEVYGMHPDVIAEALKPHGHVDTVGSSFGITKLKTPDGQDYDFSVPRRENKEGAGHKGFAVTPDPAMTPQEAAERRDFTFNSILQHPQTGEIHDYYGGLEDLKNKTLRATSEKFKEDPLRVLRGMQFAGRMGLDMDPETAQMSRDIAHEYHDLPPDRIMTEWQKFAEKSHTPSKGLQVLKDTGWDQHYPELKITPEKMQAMDNISAKLQKDKSFSPEDKNALFFATMTHDMTPDEAASFMDRINMPNNVKKRVAALKSGIDSEHLKAAAPDERNARHLSTHVAPEKIDNLMHVVDAKHGGLSESHKALHDTARNIGVHQSAPTPIANGKMLGQMGIKPGPQMGSILRQLYQAQLDGHIRTSEDVPGYIQKLTHQANAITELFQKLGIDI